METLLQNSKLVYTRRIFGKHQEIENHLTRKDIQGGFDMFDKDIKNKNDMSEEVRRSMYT